VLNRINPTVSAGIIALQSQQCEQVCCTLCKTIWTVTVTATARPKNVPHQCRFDLSV